MGTKRNGRFHQRVWKQLVMLSKAGKSKHSDARLVEECRNSHEVLSPEVLQMERELEGLCYGEYAFLTAYQRDEQFVQAFNRAVKAMWSSHHVRGTAQPELKYDWVHSTLELNVPEVRTAIRAARQHYDAMGLQYYPAIMWVLREHIGYNGGYGLPRPNQLASHLAIEALQKNERWIRERFEQPFSHGEPDPRFFACNYAGHWGQDKLLDAVQAFVENEPSRSRALGPYLVEGLISEREARRRFGDNLVDITATAYGSAKYSVNGESEDKPRTDRRACMGLSYDPMAAVCANCPVHDECVDITERAQQAQIEVFGALDVRGLRRREDAATRQRNLRTKKTPAFKAGVEAITAELRRILGPKFRTPVRTRKPGRRDP